MTAAAFVESTFATARKHLHSARVAQRNALLWGQWIYLASYKGSTARRMVAHWHAKRAMWISEAMKERQHAKLLRLVGAPTERPSGVRMVKP